MSDRALRALTGVILAGICLLTLWYGLPGDVRFEIGTKAVSEAGPVTTFTHRPLLYRLLTSAMATPADLVTGGLRSFEVVLRFEALLLTVGAAAVLWLSLRRRLPEIATPVAIGVFGALVLMGPAMTLEPEWLATVLTVAGVGAGLAFSRLWPSALLGGLLIMAAAAVKVVTLPIALIGVLALLLIDRRRALWVTVVAAVSGMIYLAVIAIAFPQEFVWLLEMRTMQPEPESVGHELQMIADYALNMIVTWPAVALLPAALVGARRSLKLAVVAGLVLAWLPALIQQQFFFYHAAAVPALAGAVLAVALRHPKKVQIIAVLVLTGWTALLISTPYEWRSERAALFWFAITVVAAAYAWWWQRRSFRADPPTVVERPTRPAVSPARSLLAGCVVALCLIPASVPTAAGSLSLQATGRQSQIAKTENTGDREAYSALVRDRIGRDTPVTYLAFGETAYFLGNPTACRYPAPVFLQRSRYQDEAEYTRSWHENVDCLTDHPGRWLVWDTTWFDLTVQPPEVQRALRDAFACERSFWVGELRACPAR